MAELGRIVRCAIHPAIGIARVGNAPDAFFIGPETPGQAPEAAGGFKDAEGRLKRQAARFRVYGFDADGQVVAELTAEQAEITWRVHIANRKAAWYMFQNAMDLGPIALEETLRNASVTGEARRKLAITPTPRQITGRGQSGGDYVFDDGRFLDQPVYLGELRTDDQGRLLVLGGRGESAAVPPAQATTFANNDGWHDDVSDGTVRATVQLGDRVFEADAAMVAVTPPDFAPGLYGTVTLYDVVLDLFRREMDYPAPPHIEFWRDIFPIFDRLAGFEAVNGGGFFLFGPGSAADFTQPDLMARLADPGDAARDLRQRVFAWFRHPDPDRVDSRQLPPFYGDAFGDFLDSPKINLSLTQTQYDALAAWAEGAFIPGTARPSGPLGSLPLAAQPHALDEANLEQCLGGPFHPGIELTWPMRLKTMWAAPFRLRLLPEGTAPRDDWGPVLRPDMALAEDGPFSANGPGTLTRLLGVPWQTDEASCLAGYQAGTYLPTPSFWAARVPNQVLDERGYRQLLDTRLPSLQRLKHFSYRQVWLRFFGTVYQPRINAMVQNWWKLGIVTAQAAPADHAALGLPKRLWVETEVNPALIRGDETYVQLLIAESITDPAQPRLEAAAPTEAMHERRTFRRGER